MCQFPRAGLDPLIQFHVQGLQLIFETDTRGDVHDSNAQTTEIRCVINHGHGLQLGVESRAIPVHKHKFANLLVFGRKHVFPMEIERILGFRRDETGKALPDQKCPLSAQEFRAGKVDLLDQIFLAQGKESDRAKS